MTGFTPLPSLLGGLLIGLAAAGVLLLTGREAGISGILDGALYRRRGDARWRVLFLAGLLAGGLVMAWLRPALFAPGIDRSLGALAVAGVLVGFGTRLGTGCTSGHGLCGVSRLSLRSMAATVTFMATGAATVFAVRHLLGGRL